MVDETVWDCICLVRQEKTAVLIDNPVELRFPDKYPLDKNRLPIYFHAHVGSGSDKLCKMADDEYDISDIPPFGFDTLLEYIEDPEYDPYIGYERFSSYNSGARSLIVKHNDSLVKMKGIGSGLYNTCFDGRTIYGWGDAMIHNVGGFLELHKARNEIDTIDWLNDHGFGSSYVAMDVVGIGHYGTGVFRKPFHSDEKRNIAVAVPMIEVESDLRLEETVSQLSFPDIDRLFLPGDIHDYIRWVGTATGRCLRELHDIGVLHGVDIHGTYNSNLLNFTVSDEKVGICDHSSSRLSDNPQKRRNELDSLLADATNPHTSSIKFDMFAESINNGYGGEEFGIERSLKKRGILAACLMVKETKGKHEFTESDISRIVDGVAEKIDNYDPSNPLNGLYPKVMAVV